MKIGELNIYSVESGYFRLDGGAMFGVVPKPLWHKRIPSDRKNRIRLAMRPILIVAPDKKILVDAGIGDKLDAKMRGIYAVEREFSLLSALANLGVSPDDIDIVILTHLHFDHCGGCTSRVDNDKIVPTFPKARYFMQKGEWDNAIKATERTRASYILDNYIALEENKVVEFLEGDTVISPCVSVRVTGGHTKFHQIVIVESGLEKAVFWGDLIPTASHVGLPYIMAYDLYPAETLEAKRRLLAETVSEGYTSFLEHDPKITAAKIIKEGNSFKVNVL